MKDPSPTLILHLSDLHLSGAAGTSDFADYKVDLVNDKERLSRVKILETTLDQLGIRLKELDLQLQYVVVSGDITVGYAADGFSALPRLLKKLGKAAPSAHRVIVVPGNHDVRWKTPAGSKNRYSRFLKLVEQEQYSCPWIDKISGKSDDPLIHDPGQGILIIPINSSNWCGSLEPLKELQDTEYESLGPKVQQEIDRHRLYDLARVSSDQLERLSSAISSWEDAQSPEVKQQTVRIAVLHHHLLPVGEKEELKPFESISNIGLLLRFLADYKIHLVMHGHKHESQVSYYTIGDLEAQHRLLIVSESTLGGVEYSKDSVAKLLEINATPNAPYIKLFDIPAVQAGRRLSWEKIKRSERKLLLWDELVPWAPEAPQATVITGDTVESVYNKLRTTIGEAESACYNLICHIRCGDGSFSVPESMPEPRGVPRDEREDWVRRRVQWWQAPEVGFPLEHFNHGSRIFDWHGKDQLENVVEALLKKGQSHRALAQLLDPRTDVFDASPSFPALCQIQFYTRRLGHEYVVYCNGYFRHQEMRLWWLVNVFELHDLLSEVVGRCNSKGMKAKEGGVTTIAAMADWHEYDGWIAVPILDEWHATNQELLKEMAFSAAFPEHIQTSEDRQRLKSSWLSAADSLMLLGADDEAVFAIKPPITQHGLAFVVNELDWYLGRSGSSDSAEELLKVLKEVQMCHKRLESTWQETAGASRNEKKIRKTVEELRGALRPLPQIVETSYNADPAQ